jgi:hypothetical protein
MSSMGAIPLDELIRLYQPRWQHWPTIQQRFWSKVNKLGPDDCWPWTGSYFHDGYGSFPIGKKLCRAHRVAYVLQNGPVPNDIHVLHSCDNPPCCNGKHLFTGTDLDNNRDMMAKGRGRFLRGEDNGFAKLNEATVLLIRQRLLSGAKQRDVAKEFGISKGSVYYIAKNIYWKHVESPIKSPS